MAGEGGEKRIKVHQGKESARPSNAIALTVFISSENKKPQIAHAMPNYPQM